MGTYQIFDLPLGAMISAAFLMSTLGESEVHLWGEEDAAVSFYLRPHYSFGDSDVVKPDLVFNSHSLTEMSHEQASTYIGSLDRLGAEYFLHANHEYGTGYTSPGGTKGRHLVVGRDVKLSENWRRAFRGPELLQNDGRVFGAFDYWEELWVNVAERRLSRRRR